MELNAIGHGKSDISGFLCELGKSIHFKALSNVDRGYLEIPFLIPPCEYAKMLLVPYHVYVIFLLLRGFFIPGVFLILDKSKSGFASMSTSSSSNRREDHPCICI